MARALAAGLLPLVLVGCITLEFDGARDGAVGPTNEARKLRIGRTTLAESLTRLGPPDLILRSGEVDRAYWVAWYSDYFKVVLSVPVPIPGRNFSGDAFILAVGSEELRMARLEFDRAGVLRDLQVGIFTISSDGQYVALDNRMVEGFLEDRARALGVTDDEDDDDDLEPPRKKKPQ